MANWIVDSLVMFFSSVVMYLFIRRGQKQNIPLHEYLIAMFVIPLVAFSFIIPVSHLSFALSWWQIGIIFLASFFFSYIGNILSQKSILLAPNPGYSLIITKSYVVFTTLFAVIFFHSLLSIQAIIAIILIVSFSALITIDKKGKVSKTEQTSWLMLAFGAFFCFAFLALFSTYILKSGVNVFTWLFYLFLFVSVFFVSEAFIRRKKIVLEKSRIFTLLIIGCMSMLFNLFTQLGYKDAPNPGYINAANASSITLLTILSAYFFKDNLTLRKIIGVVGVSIGLILLFI